MYHSIVIIGFLYRFIAIVALECLIVGLMGCTFPLPLSINQRTFPQLAYFNNCQLRGQSACLSNVTACVCSTKNMHSLLKAIRDD